MDSASLTTASVDKLSGGMNLSDLANLNSSCESELQTSPALPKNFYKQLLEVADGGTRQPALEEAKNYVAPH